VLRPEAGSVRSSAQSAQTLPGEISRISFGAEIGVSPGTLYQWRRRLSTPSRVEPDHRARSRPRVVEVIPIGDCDATGPATRFVVRLRGDRSIEVPEQFDDTELARLISTLEAC